MLWRCTAGSLELVHLEWHDLWSRQKTHSDHYNKLDDKRLCLTRITHNSLTETDKPVTVALEFPIASEFRNADFWWGKKTGEPGEKASEQGREPTTSSTHIWRRVRESNPGHIGGRRALSLLRHPCSLKTLWTPHFALAKGLRSKCQLRNLAVAFIVPLLTSMAILSQKRACGESW